jgi:hypothetical protein
MSRQGGPKQNPITQIQMSQTIVELAWFGFGHWKIEYLNLFRVSNFEIRI